jgi:hypothetical protein
VEHFTVVNVIKWLIDIKYTPQLKIKKMKKIIRLTESNLTRIIKRIINEMTEENSVVNFSTMIDELEEQVINNVFFGSLSDDSEKVRLGEIVAELATDKVKENNPNLSVNFTPYNTGNNYSIWDSENEEIIEEYKTNP